MLQGLAVTSAIVVWVRRYSENWLWCTGLASVGLIITYGVVVYQRFSRATVDPEGLSIGNALPFIEWGLSWGWVPLCSGALLILAAALCNLADQSHVNESRSPDPKDR